MQLKPIFLIIYVIYERFLVKHLVISTKLPKFAPKIQNKELNEKLESYESRLSKLEEQNKLILEKLNSLGISL